MVEYVTVPAGTYILGDPCYSIPEDEWDDILTETNYFNDSYGNLSDGRFFLGFGTAFGDGVFTGSDGVDYGVDAGLIGLVEAPEEYVNEYNDRSVIVFETETIVSNDNGRMQFGNVFIDTDPEIYYEEEYDDDYNWGQEDEG